MSVGRTARALEDESGVVPGRHHHHQYGSHALIHPAVSTFNPYNIPVCRTARKLRRVTTYSSV
jgi:hypothetical protein